MKLSTDQVGHVAKLANLTLNEIEEEKFTGQLSETLDYMAKIDGVDTNGIEPTSQVTGLINVFRDDNITPSLSQEEALANVKSKHQGFVKVKAILEGDNEPA